MSVFPPFRTASKGFGEADMKAGWSPSLLLLLRDSKSLLRLVEVREAGFMASHKFCQQLDSRFPADLRGVARPIPAIHSLGVDFVHCSPSCGSRSAVWERILYLNADARLRL